MKHITRMIGRIFKLRIVFISLSGCQRPGRNETVSDLKIRYYPLSRRQIMYVLLE